MPPEQTPPGFFQHLLAFFQKPKPPASNEGPDLFEYASLQGEEEPGAEVVLPPRAEVTEEKHRKSTLLPYLLLLFLLPLAGLLGYLLGGSDSCSIDRRGLVFIKGESTGEGQMLDIEDGRLRFIPVKRLKNGGEAGPEQLISLADVTKIEFIKVEEPEEEQELSDAERRFLGSYKLNVSNHRGSLVIYNRGKGRLGAYLKFSNWGRRVREHLSGVRVSGNRIRFTRSCKGKTCIRIGASGPFRQRYTGKLSGRNIEGTYKGGRNDTRWTAKRR